MMENAAALAGDELEKIGGLNQELEKVRVKAEAEYAGLKKSLAGYAGIVAQLPAPAVERGQARSTGPRRSASCAGSATCWRRCTSPSSRRVGSRGRP